MTEPFLPNPTTVSAGFRFWFADEAVAAEMRPHLETLATRPTSLPGFEYRRKGKVRKSVTYRFRLGSRFVYCKTVRPKNAIAYLKDLFRPSRARNFWVQTRRLEAMGFPGPRLLAFAERRRGPFLVQSLLLSEEVDGALPLYEYLRAKLCRPGLPAPDRWDFMRELGDFVGRMHRAGVIHGDLRQNNLLVQDTSTGLRFVLLDHDRTRVTNRPPRRLLLKNLQQLNLLFLPRLSFTDRLRFFHAYHAARGLDENDRRHHLLEVVAACERRLRRFIVESADEFQGVRTDTGYRRMMTEVGRIRIARRVGNP